MVMSSGGRVLVKLSEVTQELSVGIGGAIASVRTLTDISLEVRERELVVLSGSRGAGERAMLAVIAGDRRGVTGVCEVRPRTRVRLLRMGAQAALALTQEWQRTETLSYFSTLATSSEIDGELLHDQPQGHAGLHNPPRPEGRDQTPDLILLDVVPDAGDLAASQLSGTRRGRVAETLNPDPRVKGVRKWDEKNRAALLAWAGLCRQRGGAVVMAAGDAVGNGIFDAALSHLRTHGARPAHFPAAVREVRFEASTVRVVPMHCGRLGAPVRLRANDLAS